MRAAKPGDVVQIDPEYDFNLGGCFAYVVEAKSWGYKVCLLVPTETVPSLMFTQVPKGHAVLIGPSEWRING